MSISPPRIASLGVMTLALGWTALIFGSALAPAPAMAQPATAAYYKAELSQPAKDPRPIAGKVVWNCQGTTCVAPRGTSRPLRICRELFRKVGTLNSFSAKGEALESKSLERCNA